MCQKQNIHNISIVSDNMGESKRNGLFWTRLKNHKRYSQHYKRCIVVLHYCIFCTIIYSFLFTDIDFSLAASVVGSIQIKMIDKRVKNWEL